MKKKWKFPYLNRYFAIIVIGLRYLMTKLEEMCFIFKIES